MEAKENLVAKTGKSELLGTAWQHGAANISVSGLHNRTGLRVASIFSQQEIVE